MAKIPSHRDLIVWQKAMDMVMQIYHLANCFPPAEMYRLTNQITRAAVSVPANIAEGHARSTLKDYAHFLVIAKGSLMETETFLILAVRLGYLNNTQTEPTLDLITKISKILTVLCSKLLK